MYAEWIKDELGCDIAEFKEINAKKLKEYDTIIYGGGLYAEVINGVTLITKNFDELKDKELIVYTTGITPLDLRDYYDKLVLNKNFKPYMQDKIKVYNFLGKMKSDELSKVHLAALKTLKKIMGSKENPSDMEKLLINLCDIDADLTDKSEINELIAYVNSKNYCK